MDTVGVVVLYNPSKDINKNIDSYINHLDKLYIFDNSEKDNSDLFKNSKKVEYIFNNKNLGLAIVLNMAAKKAYGKKYKWLLTMDQDSIFEEDNLDKLNKYAHTIDYEKTGIVSPFHKTKERQVAPKEEIEEVEDVMTSGNLVNLSIWNKVGGWNEDYFIDNVDTEYCFKLNSKGYKVVQYNKAILEHNLGDIKVKKVFNKTFYCSNHNYIRQYYMMRNMYYMNDEYKEYFPENLKHLKRAALGRFKNILFFEKDKYRKIRNMRRGYKDYKKGIKGEYPYKN